MYYTYILESETKIGTRYIGNTSNLKQRLVEHNSGKCPNTSKLISWKLKLYIAFDKLILAQRFEKYLKSGSGHSFAKRHF